MKPKDNAAMVIAIGLVTWGVLTIAGLAWRGKSLSEGGGEILLAIAGGLSAALVAYFTIRNGNNKP